MAIHDPLVAARRWRRAVLELTCLVLAAGAQAALPAAPAAPTPAPPAAPAPAGATAPRWTVDAAGSSLEFEFTQAGARNKGRFARFPVRLDFAPEALPSSRLEVTVEMGSLDTGDKERDDTLRGPDMFSTTRFGSAHFVSSRITRTPDGYDAVGQLTLRGVTREVHVPFAFQVATGAGGGKAAAILRGHTIIRRLDFGVGQGEWKSTEWIGNDVGVSYVLRLTRADSAP